MTGAVSCLFYNGFLPISDQWNLPCDNHAAI